jgi:hypothetical protein
MTVKLVKSIKRKEKNKSSKFSNKITQFYLFIYSILYHRAVQLFAFPTTRPVPTNTGLLPMAGRVRVRCSLGFPTKVGIGAR